MLEITSSQNPKLKAAIQLHTSRGRKKQNRFVVFGERECRRAIESNVDVLELFVCEELLSTDVLEVFVQSSPASQVFSLPRELMDKLEFGGRAEGVVLVAKRPDTSLQRQTTGEFSLAVVLESIEKPGNLGAILRSCDGAGVDQVITADPLTDFFHHNCIRASMGAVFSLQLASAATVEVQQWLESNQFACFAAIVDAKQSYRDAKYTSPRTAIVFGNEANGLGEVWQKSCNSIFIPMNGIADSLNVSVSAAIVAYEASAQRA